MEFTIEPIVTEAATNLTEKLNRYTFRVSPEANKFQIKDMVEKLYGVKVLNVNTCVVRGKNKSRYTKSTINRFISGAKGTLTHEQVLKIARLFNVSTDFLLGETNIPDRKNYDIAELGLSVEAAKNLYTGRVNTEVVNLLLENARFAELTYRISQYFDDTFASGIAAQNAMLTTLSTLLRTKVKTPEAAKAAKDISLRRKPVYQGDLDDIEMYFMAAVKEIKKGIGSHYAEQEAMSKKVAEKMFTELTKGQDVQHPTITAEQLTDAMLDSVSGMEGATPEALEQLRNGLLGILQSAQGNAHEADE